MYNKVKKALKSMAYDFKEYEKVVFENGVTLLNAFNVDNIYIEIGTNAIDLWSINGKHKFTIHKKEFYLMMFELGWIFGNE